MNLHEVTKYIFIEHPLKKSDLIFVFGTGKSLSYSVKEAVSLYNKKIAPKILFTGGMNDYTKVNEAETSFIEAVNMGVPEADIIVENEATNTMENVVFSLKILEKEIGLKNIKSITIVVKNFHARRALMTLKKFLPDHIEIYVHAYTSQLFPFTKHDWFNTTDGKEIVLGEVEKIKEYLEKGHLAKL